MNTAKTNVVIFSNSRQSENIDFIYSNERLTVVDEFQYLGTIFSRKGNFGRNKARLVQQARKAMFYVLRKARKLSLPIDILLQLFDAMVALILLYGAEVWGYEKNDIAETLHLEFCKYIMKVKKCTPNYIVYGELGRVPMSVHINARMIGFWARIVNGILYRLDFCDVCHSKWLNCVKDILNKCGFINCWNDQLVPRNLSKKIKQHFDDSYVEYWKLQIFNAP